MMVLYPLAVLGARRLGLRTAALLVIALSATALLLRGRTVGRVWFLLLPLAGGLVLAAVAAGLGDHRYMLAQPVMVNAGFLLMFAASLRTPVSMCEIYARLQVPDLTPAETAYCRSLTALWCLFFVVNGGVAVLLAAAAPLTWWGLYTGLISYLLIGAVFAIEYFVRRRRFPERYRRSQP